MGALPIGDAGTSPDLAESFGTLRQDRRAKGAGSVDHDFSHCEEKNPSAEGAASPASRSPSPVDLPDFQRELIEREPRDHEAVIRRFVELRSADERIVAAFLGGSHARGVRTSTRTSISASSRRMRRMRMS
jgi:hypothetical protein